MLLAAGVVTWMLFWMRRTAANIKGELQAGRRPRAHRGQRVGPLHPRLHRGHPRGHRDVPLPARPGDRRRRGGSGRGSTLLGALIGILIAVALGYGFYRGARVINLQTFFRWTGVALIFIAGGLLSHAAHEFIEAGLITFGTATAFDISSVLPHEGEGAGLLGQLLRAMFGYTSTPEWTTLVDLGGVRGRGAGPLPATDEAAAPATDRPSSPPEPSRAVGVASRPR